jgi:transposase
VLHQPGKPYSQDLRERVLAASDEGDRVGEIAELLRVSVSFVSKVLSRRRTTGETTARPQRNHVTPKLAPLYEAIHARVVERPDGTIDELRAWLMETHAVAASVGLVWKTLKQLDLTLKKVTPRGRTGSAGRRAGTRGVARETTTSPSRQADIHR